MWIDNDEVWLNLANANTVTVANNHGEQQFHVRYGKEVYYIKDETKIKLVQEYLENHSNPMPPL